MSYKKILIAVDSSEYSLAAAKKGIALAHQLNAKSALLFVIDRARTIHSADAGILPEDAIIILKKEAEQTLDQLATMYNGKELVKFMPEGRPSEDIIKTAEIWGADLIVMGTHGRTGLMHFLMGSVAEHVLRHSKIPVMIVPSK
jgi:nucleotide-binding universal stress UspA family protein